MNLRKHYEQIKAIRETISEPFVYVTSLETPNGGKPGCVSQVEADVAARMIVEGQARTATEDEILEYETECQKGRANAREEQLRHRLRITLVNEPEIEGASVPPEPKAKSRQ